MTDQFSLVSKPFHLIILAFGLIMAVMMTGHWADPFLALENDDKMRLLQVRGLMAGQSWFDTVQYRLGFDDGVQIHWSRFVDLPIAAIIWTAGWFVPVAQAETVAFVVWPLLLFTATYLVVCRVTFYFLGNEYNLFAPLMVVVLLIESGQFSIGRLDHHNVQILCMMIALMAAFSAQDSMKNGLIGGIAAGFSLTIGLETLPYVAWLCIWPAVLLVWNGEKFAQRVKGFGLGFGLIFIFVYLLTWPVDRSSFRCDDFGLDLGSIGVLGAIGLALCAHLTAHRSALIRMASIAALAVVTIAFAVIFAPACLDNPMNQLHPIVLTDWLERIVEAQSLISALGSDEGWRYYAIPITVIIAVALLVILAIKPQYRLKCVLLLGLIVLSLGMTIYQLRGVTFLAFFALFPSAYFVCLNYNKFRATRSLVPFAIAIFFLFAANQGAWTTAFSSLYEEPAPEIAASRVEHENLDALCDDYRSLDVLATLPAGRVLAGTNLAMNILAVTDHEVLASNFHRNHDGIKTFIEILRTDGDQTAQQLQNLQVNYIVVCKVDQATIQFVPTDVPSFWTKLLSSDAPNYVVRITSIDDPVQIFKVKD